MTKGDYIGQKSDQWTTLDAGAELGDAQIDSLPFLLNKKGVYVKDYSNILLKFDTVYSGKQVEISMDVLREKGAGFVMYLGSDTAGGFDFDSSNAILEFDTTGNVANNNADGDLVLEYAEIELPDTHWVNVKFMGNMVSGKWDIYVDSILKGKLVRYPTAIGGISFWAGGNPQGSRWGYNRFYIDSIGIKITEPTLDSTDLLLVEAPAPLGLKGTMRPVNVKVKNIGFDTIKSFNIDVVYGTQTINNTITGVMLATGDEYELTLPNQVQLDASGFFTVKIVDVNGNGADKNTDNDEINSFTSPIKPAPGKKVLCEAAVGTWSGNSPSTQVYLDSMETVYMDHWVAVNIHLNNGAVLDPMSVGLYGTGLASVPVNAGAVHLDRTTIQSSPNPESEFMDLIQGSANAAIVNGAQFNEDSTRLSVSLSATFVNNIVGEWAMACALVEDSVTGSGNGWNQVNNLAGGTEGGSFAVYEQLPDPIPANLMVYRNVARNILPNYQGDKQCFPATINNGDKVVINYEFTLDSDWDLENLHIVGILVDSVKRVDNVSKSTVSQAVANGYETGCVSETTDDNTIFAPDQKVMVYPNPAGDFALVSVNSAQGQNLSIVIMAATGKIVAAKDYGQVNGAVKLPVNTSDFTSGLYIVQITMDSTSTNVRLVVE